MNCARCGLPLLATQRVVVDPQGDPEGNREQSHYDCLPWQLQKIEDELEEMGRP